METRERIEWLCRHSDDPGLADLLAQPDLAAALAEIKAAIRLGAFDTQGLIDDLDIVDEALAQAGIESSGGRGDGGYWRLPGSRAHPVVHAWVCPNGVCSRVDLDKDVAPDTAPTCPVTGHALDHIRLDT